ncbi:hypothetical protein [Algicella marina]|uniref:Uncharacterized protein n=1 Tax=Algicella marina TaxID=2683284 RepID=A0A6P1T482_9RHOB|nr:hypothetical protein [Algicella marina]QHQ36503.1 hypothetical protein GO499_15635 [Algicella marina]
MKKPCIPGAVLAALFAWAPAHAADFSDPTWPCIQRKVESLSLGLMWPLPLPEEVELDGDAEDLAAKLALRRVSLEEAEQLISEFVASHPDAGPDVLGATFRKAFEKLNADRKRLINGIGEYSLKQIQLAEKIDGTRAEMAKLMEAAEPDFDRVDALEEALDWDERIYTDRQKSLTYVCETPVLLEKRAYSLAQTLLEHAGS